MRVPFLIFELCSEYSILLFDMLQRMRNEIKGQMAAFVRVDAGQGPGGAPADRNQSERLTKKQCQRMYKNKTKLLKDTC